jgi:hypothetical protein
MPVEELFLRVPTSVLDQAFNAHPSQRMRDVRLSIVKWLRVDSSLECLSNQAKVHDQPTKKVSDRNIENALDC